MHKRVYDETTKRRNSLRSNGWLRGLEPPTSGITIQRSNQLSYSHRVNRAALSHRQVIIMLVAKRVNGGGAALIPKHLSTQIPKKERGRGRTHMPKDPIGESSLFRRFDFRDQELSVLFVHLPELYAGRAGKGFGPSGAAVDGL